MEFEHLPALVRYATVLADDRDLAQDVVHDALVRAHARWRRIGPMERPEHYVKRMVTTEYLSWRRRRARQAACWPDGAPSLLRIPLLTTPPRPPSARR